MEVEINFRIVVLFFAAALLASCAVRRTLPAPDAFLATYRIEAPTWQQLTYCTEHGCRKRTSLALSDVEWAKITKAFDRPAQSAAQERQKIALAVAAYEKIGGAYSGSLKDIGRTHMSTGGQLDCIDETINTVSLLLLLQQADMLAWHQLNNPQGRRSGFDWPHYTATISEKQGGEVYVVDSWFYDNGKSAAVLSLKKWRAGWNPD